MDTDLRMLVVEARTSALRAAAADARRARRNAATRQRRLGIVAAVPPRAGSAWRSARLWLGGRLVVAGQSLSGSVEQPCD